MAEQEFPSNSHKSREEKVRQPLESVVSGEAVQKKSRLSRRILDTFGGDDLKTVIGYVVVEVIIPAAKDLIRDTVSEGIERLLFGDSARSRGSRGGRTPYGSMYSSGIAASSKPSISARGRQTHDFGEIIIPDRVEAEYVLEKMQDMIDRYDQVTVSDMLNLCGITPSFADEKWGWVDLQGARPQRFRNGYVLNLPRTESLT